MKLHADTLPPDVSSLHTVGILLETIFKSNNLSFLSRHFLQMVGTSMGTKAAIYHLFHRPSQRNHSGSLYLGNPLLEEIYRRHFPDLPKHYQPAPIPRGLHEPPPHNQIHF